MIKTLIVVFTVLGSCWGLDLKPYNFTAQMMFHAEDVNADNCLTRLELESLFLKYDANGNGRESRHEYTEFVCATTPTLYNLAHYLFDEYDSDGDHSLDIHDYDALYVKMNPDGDGCIDEQEFIDYWTVIFTRYETIDQHSQTHAHGHSACH